MKAITREMEIDYGCQYCTERVKIDNNHPLAGDVSKYMKKSACPHDECPYKDILEQYSSYEDYFENHTESFSMPGSGYF